METAFRNQGLPFMKELMNVEVMGRMSDMNQVTPQFIMSALLEDHFKYYLDEVCNKTVINGDQVPLHLAKKEESNRDRLIELYRIFFFGEEMSEFEQAVELNYLQKKYDKSEKYLATKVNRYNTE